MKKQIQELKWKADLPALFAEIISSNNTMWIVKQPLIIVDNILREGATHALKIQDEQMIAIFARLGMYEGCSNTTHPDHKKLMELTSKDFNRDIGVNDNS